MATSVFAGERLNERVTAAQEFSAAIQEQLTAVQSDISATQLVEKTVVYAKAKTAYFNAVQNCASSESTYARRRVYDKRLMRKFVLLGLVILCVASSCKNSTQEDADDDLEDAKIEKLTKSVEALGKRIEQMETRNQELESKVETLDGRVAALEKRK